LPDTWHLDKNCNYLLSLLFVYVVNCKQVSEFTKVWDLENVIFEASEGYGWEENGM
jgi:hypothetical protein